jgi:hypothetical protein
MFIGGSRDPFTVDDDGRSLRITDCGRAARVGHASVTAENGCSA